MISKKSKVMAIIGKLNAKYWHLPFGDTSLWSEVDRALLERSIRFYNSL